MSFTPIRGRFESLYPNVTEAARSADVLMPDYHLRLDGQDIALSSYLGCGISFRYQGQPTCLNCHDSSAKLFRGGYCYTCFSTLARCDLCIVSPQRCHFHMGTCREPQWGQAFCMQAHSVYLANTSGTKVGITRGGRELRRWIDQGAQQALPIIQTPSRRCAGYVETLLKQQMSDKTNWRQLVSGVHGGQDLQTLAAQLQASVELCDGFVEAPVDQQEFAQVQWCNAPELVQIDYPVLQYSPARRLKVTPAQPEICDNLTGVIGQYLLLTQGVVFLPDYRGLALDITLSEPFDLAEQIKQQPVPLQDSLF